MKLANVVWCDGHVKATRLETLGETRYAGGPMFRFTVEED
jgi:prepilin-type processing-associated H-X9-DG protein